MVIAFSRAVRRSTFDFAFGPTPLPFTTAWSDGDTVVTIAPVAPFPGGRDLTAAVLWAESIYCVPLNDYGGSELGFF